MKLWKRFLIGLVAVTTCFVASTSVYAKISEEELYFYGQNGIYFYDGSGLLCDTTPNGLFKGEQYILTDDEIDGFARAAASENNCNINAIKNELSIMANLYEKYGSNYSSIVDYLKNGKWFAGSTKRAFDNDSFQPSEAHINAVKQVLVEGNRTLPAEVLEHDCVGDLEWIELDGVKHYASGAGNCKGTGLNNKDYYVSGKTIIQNVYGSKYIFYQWAGGPEADCGDPFGYFPENPPSASYSTATGSNYNYAGAQVWTEAELQAIEKNKPVYQKVAEKYGFPWQIFAAIHSHEHSLQVSNPENGQGIYQLYSYTRKEGTRELDPDKAFLPAGAVSDEEFLRQTEIAGEIIAGKASSAGIDLKNLTDDNIKKIFYMYNGTGYKEKALQLGFTEEQAANGEGSPYVMNRYDAARDPASASMSEYWAGRYVKDNEYTADSVSLGFGAFVQYLALAGTSSYCSSGGGTIAETAITLSWDGNENHAKDDPKPEYVKAMQEVGTYIVPCDRYGNCAPKGASCDIFVSTVMRYSGADKDFPATSPTTQENYILNHPEMYMKVDANDDISNLQPGDIFITTNAGDHIYLFVGDIDGSPAQASASFNGRTGEHFNDVYFTDSGGARIYNVYRRINL